MRDRRARLSTSATLLAGALAATSIGFAPPARGSSIGIFANTEATICHLTVVPGTQVTWYLFALLHEDGGMSGITGAEFRQDGTPTAWFVNAVPSAAANVSLGDPLADGTNIAFPACQGAFTRAVLLYTVSGFATSAPANLVFQIDRHTTPSNPAFRCPLLVLCDAPFFTTLCVGAASCMPVNTTAPSCCSVAVQPTHWSTVKALYGG